jgi:hypothetical protein
MSSGEDLEPTYQEHGLKKVSILCLLLFMQIVAFMHTLDVMEDQSFE